MHKMIEKVKCLEEKAIKIMECEKYCVDTTDGAEMADEVKDYADAIKNLYKAEYYKTVVEAIKKSEEEPRYGERAGYDNWRYSSGEFAPKGRGRRTGFMPMDLDGEPPYLRSGMTESTKYGQAYDRYQGARRHYHETKDPSSKMEMDNSTMEYVSDTMHTFREMWKDADPAMKKKMKMDLSNLVGEMTV